MATLVPMILASSNTDTPAASALLANGNQQVNVAGLLLGKGEQSKVALVKLKVLRQRCSDRLDVLNGALRGRHAAAPFAMGMRCVCAFLSGGFLRSPIPLADPPPLACGQERREDRCNRLPSG